VVHVAGSILEKHLLGKVIHIVIITCPLTSKTDTPKRA